ncbi:MAG: hypothetical protein JF612_10895 [Planctomycetia bacterium]|nr:hypothetical protein [Planctomycetia bacterium]
MRSSHAVAPVPEHSCVGLGARELPARGNADKYPVYNAILLKYLRELRPGKWQKVIKYGNNGEVHYFEHESGDVADVKFFPHG